MLREKWNFIYNMCMLPCICCLRCWSPLLYVHETSRLRVEDRGWWALMVRQKPPASVRINACFLFFFFQSWWRILSTHTSTPTRMREKLLWKRKPAAKRYYLLSISWSNDREYFMIANSKIPFLYILMLVAIYLCNMDLSPLVYKHKRKKLHIAL